mmetsp:Transcript_11295/g.33487  ORF Transcript_11295/g.33487 Transcript_11295/m.33487 type:complete len:202 (+) Transcript_11295:250-855(+)
MWARARTPNSRWTGRSRRCVSAARVSSWASRAHTSSATCAPFGWRWSGARAHAWTQSTCARPPSRRRRSPRCARRRCEASSICTTSCASSTATSRRPTSSSPRTPRASCATWASRRSLGRGASAAPSSARPCGCPPSSSKTDPTTRRRTSGLWGSPSSRWRRCTRPSGRSRPPCARSSSSLQRRRRASPSPKSGARRWRAS